MNNLFSIDVEWLCREQGSLLDRATAAEIVIYIADHAITRVDDLLARTTRDQIRVSAFLLAQWFAENWWRLRWEPEDKTFAWNMSHKLCSAGGGYVWPNFTFSSDGEQILVLGEASHQKKTELGRKSLKTNTSDTDAEPIRYLESFITNIPAIEFEHGIDKFMEQTITRIKYLGASDDGLADLWAEIQTERSDPKATAYRRLEASNSRSEHCTSHCLKSASLT